MRGGISNNAESAQWSKSTWPSEIPSKIIRRIIWQFDSSIIHNWKPIVCASQYRSLDNGFADILDYDKASYSIFMLYQIFTNSVRLCGYKENVAFIFEKFFIVYLYSLLKTKAKPMRQKIRYHSLLYRGQTKSVLKRKASLHAGIGSWYSRMNSE